MPTTTDMPETSELDGLLAHWASVLRNAQGEEAELIWIRIDAILDARNRLTHGQAED